MAGKGEVVLDKQEYIELVKHMDPDAKRQLIHKLTDEIVDFFYTDMETYPLSRNHTENRVLPNIKKRIGWIVETL